MVNAKQLNNYVLSEMFANSLPTVIRIVNKLHSSVVTKAA